MVTKSRDFNVCEFDWSFNIAIGYEKRSITQQCAVVCSVVGDLCEL